MNKGDFVFLSASVPYREGWREDAKPAEIEEAIVCLARAVFTRGGRLLFGGHPSVSPLVASIAGEYYSADSQRSDRPVVTFQSEFYRGQLPDETWLMHRMGWSSIVWTPLVNDASGNKDKNASLGVMREWMLLGSHAPSEVISVVELKPPRAMVAIGGMDGVRDETVLFLQQAKLWRVPERPRVFAIGSGGGAAQRLLAPLGELRAALLFAEADRVSEMHLRAARETGDLVGLESVWQMHATEKALSDLPFQPYAAMTQWLMDSL